jgi:exopolysaccharide biosynthesis polyprenyl glycosylphosphotransferase
VNVRLPPVVAERFSGLKAAYVLALVASDAIMVQLAFVLAARLRAASGPRLVPQLEPLPTYDDLAHLYVVLMIVTFALRHLYIPRRGIGRVDLLYEVVAAVGLGWMLSLSATLLVYRALDPPRLMLVYWALLTVVLVWLARLVLDGLLRALHRRGHDLQRVLIVGDGEPAKAVAAKMDEARELGFVVVGFVGETTEHPPSARAAGPLLGSLADLPAVIREHAIGEVLIAWPGLSHPQLVEIVASCARQHVNVQIVPDIFELMARQVETNEVTGLPLIGVRDVALRGWALMLKRAMDVVVSWTLLVLLSPVLLLTALVIKLTSPNGPVLFVQERVGLDGRPFEMIKFRSMRADAEAETGPVWTRPDDPRRTPLGSVIRRFSVDELPQLVNVLVGEMSLVGPRPERPEFVAQFARVVPRYQERHAEKAGLTGWAQVNGLRGQTSIEERTKYDLFYVENWSLGLDIKILLKTIAAIFSGENAY